MVRESSSDERDCAALKVRMKGLRLWKKPFSTSKVVQESSHSNRSTLMFACSESGNLPEGLFLARVRWGKPMSHAEIIKEDIDIISVPRTDGTVAYLTVILQPIFRYLSTFSASSCKVPRSLIT